MELKNCLMAFYEYERNSFPTQSVTIKLMFYVLVQDAWSHFLLNYGILFPETRLYNTTLLRRRLHNCMSILI